jgi:hypothetical protein
MMSFERRPDFRNPRRLLAGGLVVGTATLAIRSAMHHRGFDQGKPPRQLPTSAAG